VLTVNRLRRAPVIQITVSPAAYDAIKSSLPKGTKKLTPMRDAAGEYLI
jgi:hypothetical protein